MHKNIYNNFIESCNKCILSCEKSLNLCRYYKSEKDINFKSQESCAASYQDIISNCQKSIHEINLLLENNLIKEDIAKKVKDDFRETIDRCQESIDKILNKEENGKNWALDQIDKCIVMCDEIIEKLSKN